MNICRAKAATQAQLQAMSGDLFVPPVHTVGKQKPPYWWDVLLVTTKRKIDMHKNENLSMQCEQMCWVFTSTKTKYSLYQRGKVRGTCHHYRWCETR